MEMEKNDRALCNILPPHTSLPRLPHNTNIFPHRHRKLVRALIQRNLYSLCCVRPVLTRQQLQRGPMPMK